jgi:hypothetical protein
VNKNHRYSFAGIHIMESDAFTNIHASNIRRCGALAGIGCGFAALLCAR